MRIRTTSYDGIQQITDTTDESRMSILLAIRFALRLTNMP